MGFTSFFNLPGTGERLFERECRQGIVLSVESDDSKRMMLAEAVEIAVQSDWPSGDDRPE